jgi:hypothetical protein
LLELEDNYRKDYFTIYDNYMNINYNKIYYSEKVIQYEKYYNQIFNENIITTCPNKWCKYKKIESCKECHLYGFYEFKNTIYKNYNSYYNEINKEKLPTINNYYEVYNYKIDVLSKLITQYAILDLMNNFKKNNTDYSISTELKNINNIEYIKEIDKKLKKEVKQNIDAYDVIKMSTKNTLNYYNDILLSSLYYKNIVYLLIYITLISILLNTVFIEFGYNKIFVEGMEILPHFIEEVYCYKFSDWVGDREIDFIKIDAEGHDTKIINGMIEWLDKIEKKPYILFEGNWYINLENEIVNNLIERYSYSCENYGRDILMLPKK